MTQGYLVSKNLVNKLGQNPSVPADMVRLNSAWYTKQELEKQLGEKSQPKFVDVHSNRGKASVDRHEYEPLLKLCAEKGVEWVGISKVESPDDIYKVKELMSQTKLGKLPRICAKIESEKGYRNLEAIMHSADGIMVDAEDMATESGWENTVNWSREIYDRLSMKGYPSFRLAGVVFQYANVRPQRKVYTYGVFDLMHPGHINIFRKSRELGDYLIVGIVPDHAVKREKGQDRPMQDQDTRLQMVKALASVDEVIMQQDYDPTPELDIIRPDILAKGDDWSKEKIDPSDWCGRNNAELVTIPYTQEHSTSSLIKKIQGNGTPVAK